MDGEAVAMIVVLPTFVVVTAWAFKMVLNFFHNQRLVKLHYALQDRLLEKLGSSPEAIEYLHSDAGEKMFALATKERTNPYSRILTAMQAGAVIGLLGIGFIVIPNLVPHEGAEAFTVIGVLSLCLGLGFLASSGAAFVFSKKWGLINGDSDSDD
jgi:hypothetical protein